MNYLHLLWNLYKLKRNSTKTKAQIQSLQDKKLRRVLEYAYDNSSYYNRTFREANITREEIHELPLSSFPTIDKTLVLEHFDELITVNDLNQEELRKFDEEETIEQKTFKGNYHVVHSSGSTGKPGYFIYDEAAWKEMLVSTIRAAFWNMTMTEIIMFLLKKPRVLYIAATDGRYGGAMAVGAGIEGVHANQLFLDINTPLAEWIDNVKRFKPNVVIGYPSAIKILGELLENGEVQLDVLRLISCGEPLGTNMRNYLEKAFGTKVVNIYGASESLALGVETEEGEGMILFDDMNYIEVENNTMYLTSLYNLAQPLIRYRLSDQLKLTAADEKSHYPFIKAEGLIGRNEDIMWFENGKGIKEFLHPLAVEGFCIEGLLDYQFQQIDIHSFEMLAEVTNKDIQVEVRQEMLRQMRMILREKHLDNVKFYVQFVEAITPDPQTGKKRLIINYTENKRSVNENDTEKKIGYSQNLSG
ncbi:phenylacetate--CoA ligase family protein [Bacillus sp. AK031]